MVVVGANRNNSSVCVSSHAGLLSIIRLRKHKAPPEIIKPKNEKGEAGLVSYNYPSVVLYMYTQIFLPTLLHQSAFTNPTIS